jgi:hypothetical protein
MIDPVDPAAVAASLRAVLTDLADPDSELTATAATRHRLEGAVLALETLGGDSAPEGNRAAS